MFMSFIEKNYLARHMHFPMKKGLLCLSLLTAALLPASAQFTLQGNDTTKSRLTLEGYVDAYFAYDLSGPGDDRMYFVSHARHKEFNVNLAYLSLKYSSERARAVFTPGFGTYMSSNYAAEPGTVRNLVEAYAGVKLFKKKDIWIDAGVMASPFTNEMTISYDQLLLTRSLAPEFVPYYLSGAKLTLPLDSQLTLYLYAVNGWQQIYDQNETPSAIAQFEYKPSDEVTINLNGYYGDERSPAFPDYRDRMFFDVYVLYNPSERWNFSVSGYMGKQEARSGNALVMSSWWQANAQMRYAFSKRHSLAFRGEYFSDPGEVMAFSPVIGFDCGSASLGYNLAFAEKALFRIEGRYFHSSDRVFRTENAFVQNYNFVLTAGLAAKF